MPRDSPESEEPNVTETPSHGRRHIGLETHDCTKPQTHQCHPGVNPEMRSEVPKPRTFLWLALAFEGALGLLAIAICAASGLELRQSLYLDWASFLWGIFGTFPLLAVFAVLQRAPIKSVKTIQRFLLDTLAPHLSALRFGELMLVAMAAGVGEELLFRGAMQLGIEQFSNFKAALLVSNVAFALAHAVTPIYALLAGLTGVYLGLSINFGGSQNLLIPILIHTLYDFFAFLAVVAMYRRKIADGDDHHYLA